MSEEKQENQSSGASIIAVVLVAALPLLYVLSIGPAILFVSKTGISPKPLEVFYYPVEWLAENTPLKNPIYKYAGLWY